MVEILLPETRRITRCGRIREPHTRLCFGMFWRELLFTSRVKLKVFSVQMVGAEIPELIAPTQDKTRLKEMITWLIFQGLTSVTSPKGVLVMRTVNRGVILYK